MQTKRSLTLRPEFSMPPGELGRKWFAAGWALARPPTPEELNRPEWSRPEPSAEAPQSSENGFKDTDIGAPTDVARREGGDWPNLKDEKMFFIRWALIIAALFAAFFAGRASRASEASPWISQSSTSRFDGSPIEIAALPEDGEQDPTRKALLVVRCQEGKVNFYVSFRDATFVLGSDQIWVRYDNAPPQIVKWIPSSGSQSVGIWSDKEATEAARKIVRHETLFIRVDGRRRSEALFQLSGVEAAVEKVLSVCRRT